MEHFIALSFKIDCSKEEIRLTRSNYILQMLKILARERSLSPPNRRRSALLLGYQHFRKIAIRKLHTSSVTHSPHHLTTEQALTTALKTNPLSSSFMNFQAAFSVSVFSAP
jgi:hypothetical protein